MVQCVGDEGKAGTKQYWRYKLEEMINWKKRKMVDRTCVEIE